MNVEVDHYVILGLPTGVEGAQLSQKEIKKAYLTKALECHPDKRHYDPNAHDEFQKLKNSYEILNDEKTRKMFDHLLRVKTDNVSSGRSPQNSKRRKMASDLEKREQAAFASHTAAKAARYKEERIHRENKRTITIIRAAMHANKTTPMFKKKKTVFPSVKSQTLGLSNFVGAEFEAYEKLVLAKLPRV